MEIIVLLKQVPATETTIAIFDDQKSVKAENAKLIVNPYDEIAVEEALKIKQEQGGNVTVISVGPEKTKDAIRTSLAMGADKGLLVEYDNSFNNNDLLVAYILAQTIKTLSYDLIICGQTSIDNNNFFVGGAVAQFLGIPSISMVIKQEIENNVIRCVQTVEEGKVELESQLPVLFTTQRGLNEPRYVSLPGMMKAKKKPIDIKTLDELGIDISEVEKNSLKINKFYYPEDKRKQNIINSESAKEKAEKIVDILEKEIKVL